MSGARLRACHDRGQTPRCLGRRGVRVCVVGCGAVGSLFAANLAQLEDVEVWAYDLAREHVDAINARRAAPLRRRRRRRAACARPPMPASSRRATSASSRRRRCTRTPRRGDRARLRGRLRRVGAERARQRGGDRRARRARDPRHDVPGRPLLEPGHVQWDVKGDTTLGPFEPQPAPLEEVERLADACTRAGMPTRAVADARGPQWQKVIFNAATNPLGALTRLTHGRVCERPDLRALVSGLVDEGKAVAAAQGIELRRSRAADRPRGPQGRGVRPQGVDAPGRRGAPADRGRLPERRHRALRPASTACRRLSTRRSGRS